MRTTSRVTLLLASTVLATPALAPTDAAAADESATMIVQATVPGSCTMGTVENLSFGLIGPDQSNIDGQGTFQFSCTTTTTVDIAINAGANEEGGYRGLNNPSSSTLMYYLLFQDAAHSIEWSGIDASIPGQAKRVTTNGSSPKTETVYGRIPYTNGAVQGVYSDTITVTLTVVG